MSEQDFINYISRLQQPLAKHELGIGDDAAVIARSELDSWVVATDMLMDGRHFCVKSHSLNDIGRKCMAVNLSDLAAMGSQPRYAFVSLAIPFEFGIDRLKALWDGMQKLADNYGVKIMGGDTNSWNGPLVVNVCVVGLPHVSGVVRRSGAQVGDLIYVTGSLGGSFDSHHHLTFEPRVKEALTLVEKIKPTAMTDVSDGLSTDLHHICIASKVGADLVSSRIPVSERVPPDLPKDKRIQRALSDGEDFELLFSIDPKRCHLMESLSFKVTMVGEISSRSGVWIDQKPLEARGFEHNF